MPSRTRHLPRAFLALAIALVLDLACVYLLVWREQRVNPPTCTGIGFGCEPDPATTVFLWGFLVMAPATIGGGGLVLLSLLLPSDRLRAYGAYGGAALYAIGVVAAPFVLSATSS